MTGSIDNVATIMLHEILKMVHRSSARCKRIENQSNLQLDGRTGEHRFLVEAEPQSHSAVGDPTHRDITLGAMRQEVQG